jgi:SAM-dependent methyltransferase
MTTSTTGSGAGPTTGAPAGSAAGGSPLDHRRLIQEIDAEVAARRASGDLPPGLERELDLAFARFVPVGALEGDFEQVLARAEQACLIDVAGDVSSSKPGFSLLKRVVRKLVYWYVRHVAIQVTTALGVVVRGLKLLSHRVEALERRSPGPELEALLADDRPVDHAAFTDLVVGLLGGVRRGRVLHAGCGTGELVAALEAAGADAYGVDPSPTRAATGEAAGREVRAVHPEEHLRALPDGALGGLVASGWIDRASLGGQRALAALAATCLAPGGTVVVLGTHPRAWARLVPPVEADLAPGRPLHPETWVQLLEAEGFIGAEVHDGPVEGLAPVPGGDDEASKVLNENLARLNAALFGPSSYAVVARRPEAVGRRS